MTDDSPDTPQAEGPTPDDRQAIESLLALADMADKIGMTAEAARLREQAAERRDLTDPPPQG